MSEQPMAYEEVPGSRTLQQAVEQPQRPRWAWEELRPGDLIQDKDEWQNDDGRWHPLVIVPGASTQVRDGLRARRPHNITALQKERDEARAQGAKLSAELWARKPLEDRVAALTDEVTQLRAERQEWIDRCNAESVRALRLSEQSSAAEVAVKSAQRARDELQLQVDELREQQSPVTPADQLSFYELTEKRIASIEDELSQVRADRDKLQGLHDDLLDEPTAREVQEMLRKWATELDWSACCFDSAGRDKVSAVQRVLLSVIGRIGSMINPEDTSAND